MIQFLLSTYLLLCSTSFLLAQEANQLNIGAGYSYSSTKIGIENSLLIGLNSVEPKAGFYISLAYEHQLSSLLTSQVELIFQQKGYQHRDLFEQTTIPVRYNYFGISPTISVKPIKKLSFLFGPELNMLITKSTSWSDGKPIELGLVCRGRYQFSRMGITGGYFKALTNYALSRTGTYSFINQNWQIGLLYQLSRR